MTFSTILTLICFTIFSLFTPNINTINAYNTTYKHNNKNTDKISNSEDDFSSDAYQSMTKQSKFNRIWNKIKEDTTPFGWYSAISISGIFLENMKTTFEYFSDTMPDGRKKLIHSVGNVGLVEFIPNQDNKNKFTGIFQGCTHVIMRLSVAKEPNEKRKTSEDAYDNFIPGMGIKFLRNGIHSANTVAMFSVNGQNSWNFFKNEFSNHVPPAKGVELFLLNRKFSEATSYTTQVGLLDMAKFDEFGRYYSNPVFPYKLIFKPTEQATSLFTDHFSKTFTSQLKKISTGFHLYDLFVMDSPNSPQINLGKLVVKEQFVTSKWGDKNLWFRHSYMDDDIKVHPEWKSDSSFLKSAKFQKEFKEKYGFDHP